MVDGRALAHGALARPFSFGGPGASPMTDAMMSTRADKLGVGTEATV